MGLALVVVKLRVGEVGGPKWVLKSDFEISFWMCPMMTRNGPIYHPVKFINF